MRLTWLMVPCSNMVHLAACMPMAGIFRDMDLEFSYWYYQGVRPNLDIDLGLRLGMGKAEVYGDTPTDSRGEYVRGYTYNSQQAFIATSYELGEALDLKVSVGYDRRNYNSDFRLTRRSVINPSGNNETAKVAGTVFGLGLTIKM